MWGAARRLSLTQRVVAVVAVAIIPATAGLPYFIASIHREREREVHEVAFRTSQIAALEMERIVTGAEGILKTLALVPVLRGFEAPLCESFLDDVAKQLPQLRGIAVADLSGTVRCASGLALGDGIGNEPWFEQMLRDDAFTVGTFTGSRPDQAAFLPVALPIESNGQPEGAVVAGIDLAWLGARLRERNLARGSAMAIADRDGVILAREPEPGQYVGKRISDQMMSVVRADSPGTIEFTAADGAQRILGYQPPAATGTGLYVGASFDAGQAFAPIYASTWRSLGLAGAGALAACGIAWAVGDRLFRGPIRRILDTIASWRAGDETARTRIPPGGSELAELAQSIDGYMDGLVAARAERAEAQARRELVLREMNHRIKNILAAVQAVANQTFKNQATRQSLDAFRDRLAAMAAAHDLLVAENWENVELQHLLAGVLAPFENDHERRFALDGPPLRITPRAALSLSMSLHELCTNAAKYGALSVPGGTVAIRWSLSGAEDARRFQLDWTEAGGPPVTPPERSGFGTQLVRAALSGEFDARTELVFAATGVRFSLDAEAARLLAEGDAAKAAA
jgi:two-component sensor histidine kinase